MKALHDPQLPTPCQPVLPRESRGESAATEDPALLRLRSEYNAALTAV
jgi:hypothetical protein